MKIQLTLSKKEEEGHLTEDTFQLLEQQLQKQQEVVLTKDHPDVIHIVGGWSPASRKLARWAYSHFVPVMHTPLGLLSPWYRPTAGDIKLSEKANRLVSTGDMEYELLDGDNHQHTILIQNSITTCSISQDEMISLYMGHYLQMIQEMDRSLLDKARERVALLKEEDGSITEICRQIFYIFDLNTRGFIPEITMKKFGDTLTHSDYDEDHMADLLRLTHMDKFMADIEKRLFDKGMLLEGFMPIPMKQ